MSRDNAEINEFMKKHELDKRLDSHFVYDDIQELLQSVIDEDDYETSYYDLKAAIQSALDDN